MYNYIIIGGGISGLSAGYSLKKKKKNFLLLEKNSRLGGVIHSEKIEGFTIEKGANTVLIRNHETLQMFKDLRLLEKLKLPFPNSNIRYIINNGSLIPLPTGFKSIFFHPITPFTKLLKWAFQDFFAKPIPKDVNVKEFFTNRFDKSLYENLVFPMVSGIFAGNPENMSFQYNFPKIYEYVQKYGSILKGFKNSAQPKISQEDKAFWNKMFSFENGLETLIHHLETFLEEHIQKNTQVTKIEKRENGWVVYTNNQVFETENLILSVPANVASHFLKDLDENLSKQLSEIVYHPLWVLHFQCPTNAFPQLLKGFGFLKSEKEKLNLLGCIFSSKIFPHVSPEGHELLTVMVGGATQTHLVNEKLEELVPKVQKDLGYHLFLKQEPSLLHHQKWEHAIPEYSMNYHELEKALQNFKNQNPNIKILSNFWGGIGVPDCIEKGVNLKF